MASPPPAARLPPKRLRLSLLEPPPSLHPLSLDEEHLLERLRKKKLSRASSASPASSSSSSSSSSSRSSSCVSVCSSSPCALHMQTDQPRKRAPADQTAQLAGDTCRLASQDNHTSRLAPNEIRNDSIAPELGCLSKERHETAAEGAEWSHKRGECALTASKHESFRSERRVASVAQELECSHTGSSIAMAEQDLECSATSGSCQEYMTCYGARLQDEEAESCSGEDVQLLDINCFFENWEEASGADVAGATGLSFDPASVFQSDAQVSSDCDDVLLPAADDACMQLLAAQSCGGNEDWFLNGMDSTDGSSVLNEVLDQHWMAEAMANFDVLNADACMLHFLDTCPGL